MNFPWLFGDKVHPMSDDAHNDDVAIALLAAGGATRFGSAKQVAPIDGVAMVRRAAETALATSAPLFVVIGAHADDVRNALRGLSLVSIENEKWESGMGSSIAAAITAIKRTNASAAVILLADQPLVGTEDIQALIRTHREHPARAIAAENDSVIGPPCLFPRRLFGDLKRLNGQSGARSVLEAERETLIRVPMPGAMVDIDTRDDYTRFTRGR